METINQIIEENLGVLTDHDNVGLFLKLGESSSEDVELFEHFETAALDIVEKLHSMLLSSFCVSEPGELENEIELYRSICEKFEKIAHDKNFLSLRSVTNKRNWYWFRKQYSDNAELKNRVRMSSNLDLGDLSNYLNHVKSFLQNISISPTSSINETYILNNIDVRMKCSDGESFEFKLTAENEEAISRLMDNIHENQILKGSVDIHSKPFSLKLDGILLSMVNSEEIWNSANNYLTEKNEIDLKVVEINRSPYHLSIRCV